MTATADDVPRPRSGRALVRPSAQLLTGEERWGWEFRDTTAPIVSPYAENPPALEVAPTAWAPKLAAKTDKANRSRFVTTEVAVGALALSPAAWLFVAPAAIAAPLAAAGGLIWWAWGRPAVIRRRARTQYRRWLDECEQRQQEFTRQLIDWGTERTKHDEEQLRDAARVPQWVPLRPETTERVDVFGGTAAGWQHLLASMGASLLGSGARITALDLTQEHIADPLTICVRDAGISSRGVTLPDRIQQVNLLAGLTPEQVGSVVAEAIHAAERDDNTGENRGVDAAILQQAAEHLTGESVTFARLHTALRVLLRQLPRDQAEGISREEYAALSDLLGEAARRSAEPRIFRLMTALQRLAVLGDSSAGQPLLGHENAPLRVLELSEKAPELTNELLRQVMFQVLMHQVEQWEPAARGATKDSHVLIVIGADALRRAHVERLDRLARRRGVRLVLLFRHLRDDAAELIGGGEAAIFMKLGNAKEAEQAATYIGKEYRFVASQFTVSHSDSQSKSTSDSTTTGTSTQDSTSDSKQWTASRNVDYGLLMTDRLAGGNYSGGGSTSTSTSTGTSESTSVSTSTQDSVSVSESVSYQRTHDYTVSPTVLQHLSETAFLLVDPHDPGSPRFADCDPAILGDVGVAASASEPRRTPGTATEPRASTEGGPLGGAGWGQKPDQ